MCVPTANRSVCQKSSDSERAWALLDQMRRLQITPTISTYSALIAACVQAKDVYRAHSILEEMKTDGLQPTVWQSWRSKRSTAMS